MHARGDTSNRPTDSTDDGASGLAADMKYDPLNTVLAKLTALDEKMSSMAASMATDNEKMSANLSALDEKMSSNLSALDENMSSNLSALDEKMSSNLSALDEKMSSNLSALVATMATNLSALDEKMASKEDLIVLEEKMKNELYTVLGSFNERFVRDEAKKMFGESFAKPFLIKSVHDVVHLITKAQYKELLPQAVDERSLAANKLAERANAFAVPLAKVFMNRVTEVLVAQEQKYGSEHPSTMELDLTLRKARDAFEIGNVEKCLGYLMGACNIRTEPTMKNLVRKIEFLKKGFEEDASEGNLKKMYSCDGPGIMLLQMASKFLSPDNMMTHKSQSVIESIHYEIEMDLRGSINLIGAAATASDGFPGNACGHAVITVGEASQ